MLVFVILHFFLESLLLGDRLGEHLILRLYLFKGLPDHVFDHKLAITKAADSPARTHDPATFFDLDRLVFAELK